MLDWSQKIILKFRNRCGMSEHAMDIFTYFRVSCCCLSMFLASVLARVLHPCVALALWKLSGAVSAASSWGEHVSQMVSFWYVFALRCGQTVGNTSQAVWFGTFLHEGGKHLTGTLFLHLRVEVTVTAWKASQDYSMWLSHPRITAIFYVECPFITFILKPVSALPSPGIRFLVIVRFSFGAMAQKQCLAGSTWLQASQEWFSQLRFCWERGHSTKRIIQCHFNAEGFSYCSKWQGQQKTYLSGRFPSVAPCTESIDSICWVEVFCYCSISRVHEKDIYVDGFYYRSLLRANQYRKKKRFNSRGWVQDGFLRSILRQWCGQQCLKSLQKRKPVFLTELMWLQACQESFTQLQFCCEHWKGSTRIISEQKDSAIFQWQGQQKTFLSGLLPSIVPWQSLLSGFFLWFYPTGTLNVYIVYLH